MTSLLAPLFALQAARGRLFPWVPVALACGVGGWFALPFEPDLTFYILVAALCAGFALLAWRGPYLLQPLAVLSAMLCLGPLAAGLRAHSVVEPVLGFRYYGPIEGRVVGIDRSQSDALRLTLDHVVLTDTSPARTPRYVRVSVHGPPLDPPIPGQTVLMTGHLSAPEGPAEPGGFDFRRMAYFDGLGAVGYTRSPVLLWENPADGDQMVNRIRSHLSAGIMTAIPGDAGAFASGVMTGDRAGISLDTVVALRDSNLAHLLAISGMNMAFLVGFVFLMVRHGIALVPPLALRVNAKKIAAVVGFGVALFYLLLSGASVATERAFLMVAVMLGAVMLDRRALTLRSVALAALVLLLWQPESLLEPGFQLSFAATVVLLVGFGVVERGVLAQKVPRWMMPVFTLVLSSVLAGGATAPIAAAHFNRFTDYGLLANLLTVPMMSVLMGAGAVAAVLAPFGLAAPAFWVMDMAARWILMVAHWVAGLEGAVTPIATPQAWVLPCFTLAGLWLLLWPNRARWAGVLGIAIAFAGWGMGDRPLLLISSDGALAGVLTKDGRALSAPKGAGFSAQSWLEDDGDLSLQPEAALLATFSGAKGVRRFAVGSITAVILTGKGALDALPEACRTANLVILAAAQEPPQKKPTACVLIDRDSLRQTGALSGVLTEEGLELHPTRAIKRLWSGPDPVQPPILLQFPISSYGSNPQVALAP